MKKLVMILFGTFALATSAQAAFYDFLAEGDANERGWASFVTGTDSSIGMPAGITITGTVDGVDAFAYFDRGNAGLGVCKAIDAGNQCTPNSDDNIDTVLGTDVLKLDFNGDSDWKITELAFTGLVNGAHGDVVGTNLVDYQLDSGGWISISFMDLSMAVLGGNILELRVHADDLLGDGQEYYLASLTATAAVPLPAAVWLFGTAMLGLFGMRRKTKMEALAA